MATYSYDSGGVGSLPGGGDPDYDTLAGWEADTDNVLTEIEYLDCYDSQNHDDSVVVAGATTTSSLYREIRSASGCATAFTTNTRNSGATFEYTGSDAVIFHVQESYFRVRDLNIRYNGSGANARAVYIPTANCRVINLHVYNCTSTDSIGGSIDITTGIAINSIIDNCDGSGVTMRSGAHAYNVTSMNNGIYGFSESTGTTNELHGCFAGNNTTADYDTGWNLMEYCCAVDGTQDRGATNTANFDTNQTMAQLFNDPTNYDYTPIATSDLYQTGNNFSSSTGESTDGAGTAWGSGLDASVGALEYVTVGGTVINRSLSDNVSVYDNESSFNRLNRSISEEINISDIINRSIRKVLRLSDNVNISDNIDRFMVLTRQLSGYVNVSDAIFTNSELFRLMIDSIEVSDQISKYLINVRALFDSVSISDDLSTAIISGTLNIINRSLSDEVSIYDDKSTRLHIIRTLVDSLDIYDSLTRDLIIGTITIVSRSLSDSVEVDDSISKYLNVIRLLSNETIDINDYAQSNKSLNRILSESIDINDDISKLQSLVRVLNDNINVYGLLSSALIQYIGVAINIAISMSSNPVSIDIVNYIEVDIND